MSQGAIGSIGLRDAQMRSFVLLGPGSTAQRVEGTLTIGSVSLEVDSVYVQSGNVYVPSGNVFLQSGNVYVASGNVTNTNTVKLGEASTGSGLIVAGVAESTVPTEVSDGDTVARWMDTFGRAIDAATNLSIGANDSNEVAPALTQTINVTNLNAVGSDAGSHVGAWVNVSDYANKTVYLNYSSGATGGMLANIEVSPDGTQVYDYGTVNFTDTDVGSYAIIQEHHEYIRVRTNVNSGGTLTATITGRGGQ